MLVKIINLYGLPGIALITPTIISIPVGTILAQQADLQQVFAQAHPIQPLLVVS
jgi:hypothetical protein